MPKKRKYETYVLKEIIEEYVAYKAPYQKIAYVDIVSYCMEKYPAMANINYQDFSRNPEVKQFIEDYNINLERRLLDIDLSESIVQDKFLDVRDFYGKSNKAVENLIAEMNDYLARVYSNDRKAINSLNTKAREIKKLEKEKEEMQKIINACEIENRNYKNKLSTIRKDKLRLQNKVNELIQYIEKNIYDQAVLKHLVDIGILQEFEDSKIEEDSLLLQGSLEDIVEMDILTRGESEALEILNKLGD